MFPNKKGGCFMIKFIVGFALGGVVTIFTKKYDEMVSEIRRLRRDNDALNRRVEELENKQ